MEISFVEMFHPTEDSETISNIDEVNRTSLKNFYDKIQFVSNRRFKMLAASLTLGAASLALFSFSLVASVSCAVGSVAALVYRFALHREPPYIIVSVDGGGIRGLIPAKILSMIEEEVGEKIGNLVDCIAGSSVGGILALCLTCPDPEKSGQPRYSAKDFMTNFAEKAKTIFFRSTQYALQTLYGLNGPKYTIDGLENFLKEKMGNSKLNQSVKDVVVTSFDLTTNKGVAFHHFSNEQGGKDQPSFTACDLALATAAAPSYFPSKKIIDSQKPDVAYNLVDGGIWANNPIVVAYTLCKQKLNLKNRDVFILSLGTGEIPNAPIYQEESSNWGIRNWAPKMVDIFFSAMEQIVSMQLKFIKNHPKIHVLRLQPELDNPGRDLLDNTEGSNIEALQQLTAEYFSKLLDSGLREHLIEPLKKYRATQAVKV